MDAWGCVYVWGCMSGVTCRCVAANITSITVCPWVVQCGDNICVDCAEVMILSACVYTDTIMFNMLSYCPTVLLSVAHCGLHGVSRDSGEKDTMTTHLTLVSVTAVGFHGDTQALRFQPPRRQTRDVVMVEPARYRAEHARYRAEPARYRAEPAGYRAEPQGSRQETAVWSSGKRLSRARVETRVDVQIPECLSNAVDDPSLGGPVT